jgi:hypothetical protein
MAEWSSTGRWKPTTHSLGAGLVTWRGTVIGSWSCTERKHHTYACSLGVDGTKQLIQIAHQWLAVGDQITFRSEQPDFVERLALPELRRLEPVGVDAAQQAGMLPNDYNYWNEWNKKHLSKKPKKKVPK